jgi:hypothetical protein
MIPEQLPAAVCGCKCTRPASPCAHDTHFARRLPMRTPRRAKNLLVIPELRPGRKARDDVPFECEPAIRVIRQSCVYTQQVRVERL